MLDTYFHIGIARFRGTGVFQIADSVEIADSVVEIQTLLLKLPRGTLILENAGREVPSL